MGEHIQAINPHFIQWASNQKLIINSSLMLQLAAQKVQQQNMMIAFINIFWAATILLLLLAPLVCLLKKSKDKLPTPKLELN